MSPRRVFLSVSWTLSTCLRNSMQTHHQSWTLAPAVITAQLQVCFLYKFTSREQHLRQVRYMEDFTATVSNAAHYGQKVFKHQKHSLGPEQLLSVLKRNHWWHESQWVSSTNNSRLNHVEGVKPSRRITSYFYSKLLWVGWGQAHTDTMSSE